MDKNLENNLSLFVKIKRKEGNPRLTFLISDLGAGGAQKAITALLAHYAARGVNVTCVTLAGTEGDFFTLPSTVKRITLDDTQKSNNTNQALIANLRRLWKIRKVIKTTDTSLTVSFIAPTNILAVLACAFLPVRVIISERNDPARQSFGWMWDFLRIIFYRFADTVSANSQQAINTLSTYVPAHKLVYIPNAIEKPDDDFLIPANRKENILLAVGRLHPQKGFDTLITVFAQLHKRYPDWRLIVLGDGELRSALRQQAQALNIHNHVQFEGIVPNPYVYYARAPIFVQTSRHEGTSNALLEAMSCGLVPVVSDVASGPVKDEENGLIYAADNPLTLAEKLARLMNDRALCSRLGQAAQKQILTQDPEQVYALWQSVFDRKTSA